MDAGRAYNYAFDAFDKITATAENHRLKFSRTPAMPAWAVHYTSPRRLLEKTGVPVPAAPPLKTFQPIRVRWLLDLFSYRQTESEVVIRNADLP
jgi:hypothetical protein